MEPYESECGGGDNDGTALMHHDAVTRPKAARATSAPVTASDSDSDSVSASAALTAIAPAAPAPAHRAARNARCTNTFGASRCSLSCSPLLRSDKGGWRRGPRGRSGERGGRAGGLAWSSKCPGLPGPRQRRGIGTKVTCCRTAMGLPLSPQHGQALERRPI